MDYLFRMNLDNNKWELLLQVFWDIVALGLSPQDGPICLPEKHQAAMVFHQDQSSTSDGGGCAFNKIELQDGIHLFSDVSNLQLSAKSMLGEGDNSSDSAGLDKQTLVSTAPFIEHQGTTSSTSNTGASAAGTQPLSGTGQAQADGLGLERQRLTNLGCSTRVNNILKKARKHSTDSAYARIWNKFARFSDRPDFFTRFLESVLHDGVFSG